LLLFHARFGYLYRSAINFYVLRDNLLSSQ
jgi:hypothetical protein